MINDMTISELKKYPYSLDSIHQHLYDASAINLPTKSKAKEALEFLQKSKNDSELQAEINQHGYKISYEILMHYEKDFTARSEELEASEKERVKKVNIANEKVKLILKKDVEPAFKTLAKSLTKIDKVKDVETVMFARNLREHILPLVRKYDLGISSDY